MERDFSCVVYDEGQSGSFVDPQNDMWRRSDDRHAVNCTKWMYVDEFNYLSYYTTT